MNAEYTFDFQDLLSKTFGNNDFASLNDDERGLYIKGFTNQYLTNKGIDDDENKSYFSDLAEKELMGYKHRNNIPRFIPSLEEVAHTGGGIPKFDPSKSVDENADIMDKWKESTFEKFKTTRPAEKEDINIFLNDLVNENIRKGIGADTNPFVDKLDRAVEGFAKPFTDLVAPEWSSRVWAKNFAENPESDEGLMGQFAGGFGQLMSQMAIGAALTATGNPEAVPFVFAGLYSAQYMRQGFEEEWKRSGDLDKAWGNAVSQLPAAALDTFSDAFLFLRATKTARGFAKEFAQAVGDEAKRKVLAKALPTMSREMGKQFLAEGLVGGIGAEWASGVGSYYATGNEGYLRTTQQILESGLVEGILGGLFGGMIHKMSSPGIRAQLSTDIFAINYGQVKQEEILQALKDKNYNRVIELTKNQVTDDASIDEALKNVDALRGGTTNKKGEFIPPNKKQQKDIKEGKSPYATNFAVSGETWKDLNSESFTINSLINKLENKENRTEQENKDLESFKKRSEYLRNTLSSIRDGTFKTHDAWTAVANSEDDAFYFSEDGIKRERRTGVHEVVMENGETLDNSGATHTIYVDPKASKKSFNQTLYDLQARFGKENVIIQRSGDKIRFAVNDNGKTKIIHSDGKPYEFQFYSNPRKGLVPLMFDDQLKDGKNIISVQIGKPVDKIKTLPSNFDIINDDGESVTVKSKKNGKEIILTGERADIAREIANKKDQKNETKTEVSKTSPVSVEQVQPSDEQTKGQTKEGVTQQESQSEEVTPIATDAFEKLNQEQKAYNETISYHQEIVNNPDSTPEQVARSKNILERLTNENNYSNPVEEEVQGQKEKVAGRLSPDATLKEALNRKAIYDNKVGTIIKSEDGTRYVFKPDNGSSELELSGNDDSTLKEAGISTNFPNPQTNRIQNYLPLDLHQFIDGLEDHVITILSKLEENGTKIFALTNEETQKLNISEEDKRWLKDAKNFAFEWEGNIYFIKDNLVGLDYAKFNRVMTHEAIHIASDVIKKESPELYNAAKHEILNDKNIIEFMNKEYPSFDKLSDEVKVAETIRAIVEGRFNGRTSGIAQGSKLHQFLTKFLNYLKDLFSTSKNKATQIIILNTEEFLGLSKDSAQSNKARRTLNDFNTFIENKQLPDNAERLRDLARIVGLKVTGTKEELISRLNTFANNNITEVVTEAIENKIDPVVETPTEQTNTQPSEEEYDSYNPYESIRNLDNIAYTNRNNTIEQTRLLRQHLNTLTKDQAIQVAKILGVDTNGSDILIKIRIAAKIRSFRSENPSIKFTQEKINEEEYKKLNLVGHYGAWMDSMGSMTKVQGTSNDFPHWNAARKILKLNDEIGEISAYNKMYDKGYISLRRYSDRITVDGKQLSQSQIKILKKIGEQHNRKVIWENSTIARGRNIVVYSPPFSEPKFTQETNDLFKFRLANEFTNADTVLGLKIANDGTLPLVNLIAKIRKSGAIEFEKDTLTQLAKDLAKNNRVNVKEFSNIVNTTPTVIVNKLRASFGEIDRAAELLHAIENGGYIINSNEDIVEISTNKIISRDEMDERFIVLYDEYQQILKNNNGDLSGNIGEAATGRYGVDPYTQEELDGLEEISPGHKLIWSGDLSLNLPIEQEVKFTSRHYEGDIAKNQLAFVRGAIHEYQDGTILPDGTKSIGVTKILEIWEVQSDWKNASESIYKDGVYVGAFMDGVLSDYNFDLSDYDENIISSDLSEPKDTKQGRDNLIKNGYVIEKKTPLLKHWETLALKAAVNFAQQQGATDIIVSDAETAMMTEGHDTAATKIFKKSGDPIEYKKTFENTQQEAFIESTGKKWYDSSFEIVEGQSKHLIFAEDGSSYMIQGFELIPVEVVDKKISQEKGMRAAYDKRIPDIVSKLTDSKPKNVTITEHYKGPSRVFKNPNGSQKNTNTGRMFSLNNVENSELKFTQETNDDIERRIALAHGQRGIPESTMLKVVKEGNKNGSPAIISTLLEHFGDLSDRASRTNAIVNVHEKLTMDSANTLFDYPNRWDSEKEINEGFRSNAEYMVLQKHPEIRDAEFEKNYERYEKLRSEYKDEIDKQEEINRKALIPLLDEYIKAHKEHNNPINRIGKLGKNIAIKFAEYAKSVTEKNPDRRTKLLMLRSDIREALDWVDNYYKDKTKTSVEKLAEGVTDIKPTQERSFIDDGIAQYKKLGWNYEKWGIIPQDLANKSVLEAVLNDPSLTNDEKEIIKSFVPGGKNYSIVNNLNINQTQIKPTQESKSDDVIEIYSTDGMSAKRAENINKIIEIRKKKLEAQLTPDEKSAWKALRGIKRLAYLSDDALSDYVTLVTDFANTRRNVEQPGTNRIPIEEVLNKVADLTKAGMEAEYKFLQEKFPELLGDKQFSDFENQIDLVHDFIKQDMDNPNSINIKKIDERRENWLSDIEELRSLIIDNYDEVKSMAMKRVDDIQFQETDNKFIIKGIELSRDTLNDFREIFNDYFDHILTMPTDELSNKDIRKLYYSLMGAVYDGHMLNMQDFVSSDTMSLLTEDVPVLDLFRSTGSAERFSKSSSWSTKLRSIAGQQGYETLNKLTARFRQAILRAEQFNQEVLVPYQKEKIENAQSLSGKTYNNLDLQYMGIYSIGRQVAYNEDVITSLRKNMEYLLKSTRSYDESSNPGLREASSRYNIFINNLFDGVFDSENPLQKLEENASKLGVDEGMKQYVGDVVDFFKFFEPMSEFTKEFIYGREFKGFHNYIPIMVMNLTAENGQPMQMDVGELRFDQTDEDISKLNVNTTGLSSTFDRTRTLRPGQAIVFNINHMFANRGRLNILDYFTSVSRREMSALLKPGTEANKALSEFLKDERNQHFRMQILNESIHTIWNNEIAAVQYIHEWQRVVNDMSSRWAGTVLSSAYQFAAQSVSNLLPYVFVNITNPSKLTNIFKAYDYILKYKFGKLSTEQMALMDKLMLDLKHRHQDAVMDTSVSLDIYNSSWQKLKSSSWFQTVRDIDKVRGKLQFLQFQWADMFAGLPMMLAEYTSNEEKRLGRTLRFEELVYNPASYFRSIDESERFIGIGNKSRRGEWLTNRKAHWTILRHLLTGFASHRINNATNAFIEMRKIANPELSTSERAKSLAYLSAIGVQSASFSYMKLFVVQMLMSAISSVFKDDKDEDEAYKELIKQRELTSDANEKKVLDIEIAKRKQIRATWNSIKQKTDSPYLMNVNLAKDVLSNIFVMPNYAEPLTNVAIWQVGDKMEHDQFYKIKKYNLDKLKTQLKNAKNWGNYDEVAEITAKIKDLESLEALHVTMANHSLIPYDGMYGGAIKNAANVVTAFQDKYILGSREMSATDFFSMLAFIGYAQGDISRVARVLTDINRAEKSEQEKLHPAQ